jgi:hypothetical protein
LVAAAYLHDLGYAPALIQTGFHASMAPATSGFSGGSGWPGWSRTTLAPGVRLSYVGGLRSWPSSQMRPRPRRWPSPTAT